ncbi:MAG: PSD1 and planctomycete cytochrome C domain-containing protein [Bryobacteraceae bacterium]|nr:PSD1 and planctomycete cytochrome C domain-containing protein [Bryobacteraceae bacterium]
MRLFIHLYVTVTLAAQTPEDLFRRKVQPVLAKDCVGCHGEGQTLSRLDLRSREAMLKGGARGPSIVPGKSGESLLFQVLTGSGKLQMPPGDKRLPADVVEAFARWIDGGAPYSAASSAATNWDTYKEEDLWAFRPLKPRDKRRSIDDFISAELRKNSLAPAPPADRRTLIRRAAIDLTGLPPTPEEVAAFVNDKSADAYPKLIERLLASPRYGERWGRHWLDVVRYADSSGYSNDFERPNAWRFRDYVIRAFNNDKPYDRFIREQVAGDELYPGNAEALIATGFLRAGPWEHTGMSVEAVTRQMFLDDVTNSVGVTFLGLTLGCARCHDHKFDPIPTRDYYRVQAVFATTEFARPKLPFLPEENVADVEFGRAHLNKVVSRTGSAIKSFDERITREVMKRHGVTRPEDLPPGLLKKALQERKELSPDEFENFKLYQKHMQLYRESQDRYEPKAFAVSSGPLDGATDGGPNLKYPSAASYKAPDVHILPGGNVQSPAGKVSPGALALLARYGDYPEPEMPAGIAGRRTALANWIASPKNPLTARVMANRIWQYHFGKGIAGDSSNFGKMGKKPSHPELLDWLAGHFIDSGWSVKAMHRAIMLSAAYQRSGNHPGMDAVRTQDPENLLLSHYSPRRVEAEVLRDSILAAAGELSLETGGPGVFPQINDDVARQPQHRMGSLAPAYHPSPLKRLRNRRSIYAFQQRSMVDPMIDVFNGPSLDLSCERRETSTVPTQAFSLFNGRFVQDMALAFAARVEKEASTPAAQIGRAFELAYGRPPSAREAELALAHLARMTEQHRAAPPPPRQREKPLVHKITSELTGETFLFTQQPDPEPYEHNLHPSETRPETRALADVALVLLNSNEFAYLY